MVTDFLIDWVGYQIECFPSIEGIFLLDDIVGFVGDDQCNEYVVPYFKKIYGAFNAKINMLQVIPSFILSYQRYCPSTGNFRRALGSTQGLTRDFTGASPTKLLADGFHLGLTGVMVATCLIAEII